MLRYRYPISSRFLNIIFLAILAMPVCASSADGNGGTSESCTVVAQVRGTPICEENVLRRIRIAHGEVNAERVGNTRWQAIREAAIDSEILDRLLLQAARAEGMEVDETTAEALQRRVAERLGKDAYRAMLAERDASEAEFRAYLREQELIDRYREALYSRIEIEEEVLRKYLDGHRERFTEPAAVRLEVVTAPYREEAQAQRRLWVAAGEDDGAMGNGGPEEAEVRTTRWVPLHALPAELQDPVRSAAAGAILDPQRVGDAWYVVRVLERREERTRDYEEARDDVRDALRRNREDAALTRWFERQLSEAVVEYVQ